MSGHGLLKASGVVFATIVLVASVMDLKGASSSHAATLAASASMEAASSSAVPRTATKQQRLLDIKGSHKSGEKMALADADGAGAGDAKEDGKGGAAPNISQIWAVREFFVNIAGIALLTGICLLIGLCCFTQRGCYAYDTWVDKDKHEEIPDDEEVMLPGDTTKK